MNIFKKLLEMDLVKNFSLFLKKRLFKSKHCTAKNLEALLYTLGKRYGTLRHILQRSE